MSSEWGRSPQDTRHRFNTGAQIRMPYGVNVTTQVNWSSSRPFNITTGTDDNADNSINDRPTFAALCASPLVSLLNGINCSSPSNKIIPRNLGNGPGQFNVTMNFQKTVRLTSPEKSPANRAGAGSPNAVNNFVEPQRGGGGGGGGGFGGNNGGFGGNNGGDFGGQRNGGNRGNFPNGGNNRGQNGNFNNQQNNGKTVTFQFQIQNLLNNTQLNGYSGTMTSSFFGKASSARNARQVEAGLRFNF
jgi:hypothetical protein